MECFELYRCFWYYSSIVVHSGNTIRGNFKSCCHSSGLFVYWFVDISARQSFCLHSGGKTTAAHSLFTKILFDKCVESTHDSIKINYYIIAV